MNEPADLRRPEAPDRRIIVERNERDEHDMGNLGTGNAELLPASEMEQLRGEWERVQVGFVDQPREAVEAAHELVDEVIDRMTDRFASQRDGLMETWARGDDVSTEDLRVALQSYRSFFNRLLSA